MYQNIFLTQNEMSKYLDIFFRCYLEIFKPDNHERKDAGLSGFLNKTMFSSFKSCGNSGSESAVMSATGTFS